MASTFQIFYPVKGCFSVFFFKKISIQPYTYIIGFPNILKKKMFINVYEMFINFFLETEINNFIQIKGHDKKMTNYLHNDT